MADYAGVFGRGVAVVALRSKRLLPKRVMRKVEGQFGSGHATSESDAIQSSGSRARCFAGSNSIRAARE
jgi:hypothetical protein